MDAEELTQIVTAHQSAIGRQSQSMAEHEVRMARIEAILESTAQQQVQNQQGIANLLHAQELTRQDVNSLVASLQELRNQISDYMSDRNR